MVLRDCTAKSLQLELPVMVIFARNTAVAKADPDLKIVNRLKADVIRIMS